MVAGAVPRPYEPDWLPNDFSGKMKLVNRNRKSRGRSRSKAALRAGVLVALLVGQSVVASVPKRHFKSAAAIHASREAICCEARQEQTLLPQRATPTGAVHFDYSADGTDDQFRFQLDARDRWRRLTDAAGSPVTVRGGDVIEFQADDVVCALSVDCTGPEGQGTLAKYSDLDADEFPVQNAHFQSLVGRIDGDEFEIGRQRAYQVPMGGGTKQIELMTNIRLPELAHAEYGYSVKVRIRRAAILVPLDSSIQPRR